MFRALLLVLVAYSHTQADIKVLFLGDSITAGYGLSVDEAYPAIVESLSEGNIKAINAGISGDTTAGGVSRVLWSLKKHNPDVLFIALGANDGLRGFPLDVLKNNLQKIISLAKDHDSSMTIILSSIRMPPTMGADYTNNFTKAFGEVAQQKHVVLHEHLLRGVAGQDQFNLPDGIHPNKQGQKLIAQSVLETLQQIQTDSNSAAN